MSAGAPTVNVGDIIAGRYRVQGWIGQGHMAVVYKATHEGTGKPCALKLVHTHLVSRQDVIDLFLQEARVGGRIGHNPYIVDVFDAAVDEARRVPYLAMELLQGEPLDQFLQGRGPMPVATFKVLFQQLGEALDQAHAAGVVHRDLKPANLFLTQSRKGDPVLKVVDFGIAKVLELEAQRTATQIGSPAYAAPEQLGQALRKLAAKNGITIADRVSGASDVWAAGLIAYELLTGLVSGQFWGAFDSLGDLVTRVVLEDPAPATFRAGDRAHLLPPGFDAWLSRCIAKDASQRFATAGDAAAHLVRLLDGESDAGRTVRLSPEALAAMGASPIPEPETIQLPRAVSVNPAPAPSFDNTAPVHRDSAPPEGAVRLSDSPAKPRSIPPPPVTAGAEQLYASLDRSSGSLPPDTSAAGTKPQATSERSTGSLVLAALLILVVIAATIFVLLPKKGHLRIEAKDEGGASLNRVEIFVDGQKVCDTTPCIMRDISPGVKTVKIVAADGRMSGPIQENVRSGEESSVTVAVTPAAGAPPPSSLQKPALAASPAPVEAHSQILSVEAAPPAIPSSAPQAPVTAAPVASVASSSPKLAGGSASAPSTSAAAQAESGTLNINSIPVAKIVLDGRALGNTPRLGVLVSPGSHTVQFIHAQLGKKTVTVTVKAGETKTASTKFE